MANETGAVNVFQYTPPAPRFEESDDWSIYKQPLDQYFIAYNITEEARKSALLLTAISSNVFRTLVNLCFPDEPNKKSFKDLSEIFKKQFSPIVSIFAERCKFYEARQEENETVTEWLLRIRKLSTQCELNAQLESALRDKFITGMKKGPVLDRMFELAADETLTKCVEAAQKRELTVRHKSNVLDVHKLNAQNSKKNSQNFSNGRKQTKSPTCFSCGKGDHDFKTCKYKAYKCKQCQQTGHLATVCKKKKEAKNNFLNIESDDNGNQSSDDGLCLFNLVPKSAVNDSYQINLNVNNKDILFEIDTGAAVSVCSKELYERHFANLPLKKSTLILKSYDKSVINPIGSFEANIKYANKTVSSEILVIQNGGCPLIGRDILRKLKFSVNINAISATNINEIVKKYDGLFENKLGCFKVQ